MGIRVIELERSEEEKRWWFLQQHLTAPYMIAVSPCCQRRMIRTTKSHCKCVWEGKIETSASIERLCRAFCVSAWFLYCSEREKEKRKRDDDVFSKENDVYSNWHLKALGCITKNRYRERWTDREKCSFVAGCFIFKLHPLIAGNADRMWPRSSVVEHFWCGLGIRQSSLPLHIETKAFFFFTFFSISHILSVSY